MDEKKRGRQTKLSESDIKYMTYLRDIKKMSYPEIAQRYSVDHSTVMYHLKNYYQKRYSKSKLGIIEIKKVIKEKKIDKYPVEEVNLGKSSYKEYIKEQKDREFKKLTKNKWK